MEVDVREMRNDRDHKKEAGLKKPIPGQRPERDSGEAASSTSARSATTTRPRMGDGGSLEEILCGSQQDWQQFSGLLHRMVENHIALHGSVTQGEFYHIASATCLCYHTMGSTFVRSMESMERPVQRSPGGGSTSQTSATRTVIATAEGRIAGNNRITFGRYKGYTFEDVYEMDESYVQFCLDEKSKGEAYCTSMARFQSYCEDRRQHESREPVAYMVMEESTDEDEGLLMFLDSGCNSTCHGERWMRRYEELSGYTPEWTSRTVRPMTGIGGAINALGVRKLYVGLETMEGYKVPGEVSSTEIEDSNAPMLLSLQAQEALGLVLDLANMVVTSRMLGCTFKAVRGKNKLIGLRLYPGDFLDDGVTIPVSMMAAEDTKMTYQTKAVPKRGERWSPPRGGYGRSASSGETPPWRSRSPEKRHQQTGPSSSTSAPSTRTTEEPPRPSRAPEVEEYVNVVVEDEDEEHQEAEQNQEEGIDAAEEEHDYEDDEVLEEDFAEVVQKNQEYVDDELRRRGYLDEDTPPFAEEAQEEDFWEITETSLIRHHFEARVDLFYPNDSLSELPVDVSRLGEVRVTNMSFVGTREQERHEDFWRTGEGTPEVSSMSWVGSTEFELKPIEEELKMARMTWEDGDKKVMNKGQKKRLAQEVESMENEDYAMWSTLRRQKIGMPKGWKALMEIFAGCAVLTSVFQSEGYECCQPLDILGGWDVHNAQHRQWAEEMARREKPYLMSYAFVCGPWSPWQRMCEDREKVNEKRRVWMPVFRWMYKMIKEQQHRGGVSLMENPWTSEAWSTSEILKILELNFEYARVDMCTMGLVDRENKLPHKKMTCIASDSKGIIEEMKGKLCKGDHQHQPLEGRNCYGSRCYQAGRYTRKFCGHIVKGVQRDLEDQLCMAFHAESMVEDLVEEREEPTPTFDAIKTEEDVAGGLLKSEKEKEVNQEEDMELLDKEADPEGEKLRKAEWRKLSRVERIGVRRLHHMTSHGTRNQMARMLRYANAAPHVVKGVKYFRCPACDRVEPERRPQVVRGPDPYAFNEEIGLDIFTVKDVFDKPYQILHILCLLGPVSTLENRWGNHKVFRAHDVAWRFCSGVGLDGLDNLGSFSWIGEPTIVGYSCRQWSREDAVSSWQPWRHLTSLVRWRDKVEY